MPTNTSFHDFHKGDNGYTLGEDNARPQRTAIAPVGNPTTRTQFTKFVQRWLYFEVLRAVLGHLHQFDLLHFIRRDTEQNSYITTERLPRYLEDWLDFESSNPAESVARLLQAQLVLDRARRYVFEYCSVSDVHSRPIWPIDDHVALSIMILGETLTSALIKIRRQKHMNIHGWSDNDYSSQGWGYSRLVLQKMRAERWCLKTITMLQGVLRNNTIGLLYALQIPPQEKAEISHLQCTETECKPVAIPSTPGSNIDLQNPEPFHCKECDRRTCKEVQVNSRELNRIIKQGKIPLLRYRHEAGKIDLVEMNASCNKEYVIFSHVWADGYGNKNANAMNKCVLDMFRNLFNDIKSENVIQQSHGRMETPENFWIDTLAIPVETEFDDQRKKAIRKMHDIYTNAKYTIVLDAGLMSVDKGEGYIKPAMSITLSKWMTRLWTLQEAVLSKSLYFNFSDQVYSMDKLEKLFQQEDAPLHSCLAFVSRAYYHGILEKESRRMHGPDSTPEDRITKPAFVANVWKAVQWRRTEHRQHETLALATLLNVDTDSFADSSYIKKKKMIYDGPELQRRMQKLVDLLAARSPCAIPAGIIFVPGPRLEEKGYGWAPRTWLSSKEVEPPDPLALQVKKARLNVPHGLEVWFPGFRLHNLRNKQDLLNDLSEFHFPADRWLSQWYRVIPADEKEPLPHRSRDRSRELAIVAPQLLASNPKEIGLLVAIAREQDGILFVEILHRIYISVEGDAEKIRVWRNDFLAEDFGSLSCGERLSTEQHWCIDGQQDNQPLKSFITNGNGELIKPLSNKNRSFTESFGLRVSNTFHSITKR
ncbi:uncharacterized protein KY384_007848 [Bacidia gigantensis]|uniref:uncharacterized protein n=1 Tax=Bacidia gigantensis TaxID=2732470 RepID=UPI001D040CB0|nr:uncharacterized protein KY384_007848 [Bacidia gigantensis]KAG8527694.1 hypothetical protein KY384_007848 [Bacidia gigantensis]